MKEAVDIIIFCDGACLGNPGPGATGWILKEGDHVQEGGERVEQTTNNRMELLALLTALENISTKEISSLKIYSDSKYVLTGISSWVAGWKRRGWLNAEGEPVKHRDLWEALDAKIAQFPRKLISFNYTPGHQGIPGNERCDEIASTLAQKIDIDFYKGDIKNYSVSFEVTTRTIFKEPVYLAYVGGKLYRDKTWKECEARVRGNKGAKYKKVKSQEEEAEILRSWGIT